MNSSKESLCYTKFRIPWLVLDSKGVLNRFRELVHLRYRPLIVAIGTAGETACPTLLDQSFGEVGGAGGFACRWKLISIAHPNPENGYATHSKVTLETVK